MHKLEGDSASIKRKLGCQQCEEVTLHVVVEESYDATTKQHELIKVCQKCDFCDHFEVTPAELEVIEQDEYY